MPKHSGPAGSAEHEAPFSFDAAADELYGLVPEEFTAARRAYETKARRAGARELAAAVHALAKPSASAWLANQLARERRNELAPLLELGAGLREATRRLAGDALRQLSRQQHELVYALVQQARELGAAGGHPVSEATARGLADTLHAALADEQAAQQLLAGRLTEPLQRSGFDGLSGQGGKHPEPTGSSAPAPSAAARRSRSDGRAAQAARDLAAAESEVAEAERALAAAVNARDDARSHEDQARQSAEAAHEQVAQLRRQLDDAGAAAAQADHEVRDRAATVHRAECAVSIAERRHADAGARRDRLEQERER